MRESRANHTTHLFVAAVAAFCTYCCMYGFRKPFTAGTYEGQEILGLGLKTALVISQLVGYMLSKFIGIRVVSEMRSKYRAAGLVSGRRVLILGAGMLDLTAAAFARSQDAQQVGVSDPDTVQLARAGQFGADHLIEYQGCHE